MAYARRPRCSSMQTDNVCPGLRLRFALKLGSAGQPGDGAIPSRVGTYHLVLTTEHFVMQSARAVTLSDAQTRSTIFNEHVERTGGARIRRSSDETRRAVSPVRRRMFRDALRDQVADLLTHRSNGRRGHLACARHQPHQSSYLEIAPQLEPYLIYGNTVTFTA